jgi:hypothetical protein
MIKEKKSISKCWEKNSSQPTEKMLTRLTNYLGYEIRIIPQKKKMKQTTKFKVNNLVLNYEIEKKNIHKKT